jgi:hypothetical protein
MACSLPLKFLFRLADNSCMDKHAPSPWLVEKDGTAVRVVGSDSSVVAVLPDKKNGDTSWIKEAYLIAAAPQLFEACCKINSILENSLIVTPEGFKINCSDIRISLTDAILRAVGCRKAADEP